jgi:extracellular factor (EF) 3-hydroxypalmitic acid methyl ester biosynthesis protein
MAGVGHRALLVSEGDRLEGVRILCREALLYEGEALVRHAAGPENGMLLGIELLAKAADLSLLYRLAARHGFSARMDAALGPRGEPVPDGFKVWANDQRLALEGLKTFLDSEERALEGLDLLTRRQTLAAYLEEAGPRVIARMNQASSELTLWASGLRPEQHAACRSYYKGQLHPLILHSPFMRRAFAKPLGYAGDYEMMNMLYRDHAEGDSLFAQALNLYATQEGAARANINRIAYLGARIREAVGEGVSARVVSIGCGPAREIGSLLEREPALGRHLDVALIDQEERVLAYCESTLSPLAARTGARIRFIRESVRRLVGARGLKAALGERDLIYSAGLFDYLDRKSFAALLGGLYEALAPGGHLCVGNVGSHNPTRYAMEYLLDWFLIHRGPDELEGFARELDPLPRRFEIDAEPSGINLFLRIWK